MPWIDATASITADTVALSDAVAGATFSAAAETVPLTTAVAGTGTGTPGAAEKWQPLPPPPPVNVHFKSREAGAWVSHTAVPKVRVAGAWVVKQGKYWNGSSWVNLP